METEDAASFENQEQTLYFFLIWAAAALGLLFCKVSGYRNFIRSVKAEMIPVSDNGMLELLSAAAKQAGFKKPPKLCVHPLIFSPMLIGLFQPCIVLPEGEIFGQDFQYIVLHELTHAKRLDICYKWLVQITVSLHWFNPLAYIMSKEIAEACEFSCDEAVLAKAGGRREYGKTLLSAAAAIGRGKKSSGAVTLSGNKQLLKERLSAIMNFKKKSGTVTALTVLLTMFLAFGAFMIGGHPVSAAACEEPGKEKIQTALPVCEEPGKEKIQTALPVRLEFWEAFLKNLSGKKDYEKDEKWEDDDWEDDAWNWEDDDWEDDDWDWEDDDWDWEDDWDEKEDEKKLLEEYAAFGITTDGGKRYYYQGELVNIFLDRRPNSSFYVFSINPEGTADVEILRGADGKIKGVSYLSEKEIEELSEKLDGIVARTGPCRYQVTGSGTAVLTKLIDKNVKKIEIPKTVKIGKEVYKVTAIGKNVFKNNQKLTSVKIGDHVKTIDSSALEGCANLVRVTLGKNVTELGDSVFRNCKRLKIIAIKSTKLRKAGKNAFKGIRSTAKIQVPAKKLSAYKKLFRKKGQGKKVKIVKITV